MSTGGELGKRAFKEFLNTAAHVLGGVVLDSLSKVVFIVKLRMIMLRFWHY